MMLPFPPRFQTTLLKKEIDANKTHDCKNDKPEVKWYVQNNLYENVHLLRFTLNHHQYQIFFSLSNIFSPAADVLLNIILRMLVWEEKEDQARTESYKVMKNFNLTTGMGVGGGLLIKLLFKILMVSNVNCLM